MNNLTFFSFVDLTQVRKQEILERRIERLLHGEEESPPFHYSLIRPGIRKFCFTGFDPDVLDALFVRVSTHIAIGKYAKNDKANCLLAIGLLKTMLISIPPGISFAKGETMDLPLGGIVLHIATDAILTWVDASGTKHIGAVKAKIRKGNFPRESVEMAASLIAEALKAKYPDAIIDSRMCFCLDVFRQRLVPAVNMSRNLDDAFRVAELISSRKNLAA